MTSKTTLAGRIAQSRVVFGAHETNLGVRRSLSSRHTLYYEARARGGCGVVVTETASVCADDWPYERAPLAADCGPGWRAVVEACRPHGTLVLAGLGHHGSQGSSAYSQSVLWAPSPVADVVSREMPAEMGEAEIAAVLAGFAESAAVAVAAGVDGVELDAGPTALLRQFLSPLTNLRLDRYGTDRARLLREAVGVVRDVVGRDRVLALRLSCDELAPWGGITVDDAVEHLRTLADSLDLVTVVRGGPTTVTRYRPDHHVPAMFNVEPARKVRAALAGRVAVVLQGSVVDPDAASRALDDGVADLVEMTRAQIADPDLVRTVRAGRRPRPCVLCNQECLVRDPRNPLVSCIGNPTPAESDPPPLPARSAERGVHAVGRDECGFQPLAAGSAGGGVHAVGQDECAVQPVAAGAAREVLVVGGGPAGLEAARVLAATGRRVRIAERESRLGGMVARTAVGDREGLSALTDWLADECLRLGVRVELCHDVTAAEVVAADAVVLATGSVAATWPVPGDGSVSVHTAAEVTAGRQPMPGAGNGVLVWDPVGGPVGVATAELLAEAGGTVGVVTPDPVLGTQLGRTGDLADANGRLQRAGVARHLRSRIVGIADGRVELEHVHTGERTTIAATAVIDCGHRLPDDDLVRIAGAGVSGVGWVAAGDCVAPRTVAEAVREGRAAAAELVAGWTP
ncbi:FAD-dependent oxidoreductase [Rhodococcus gannanensis]|uniref:oxidoreductase n=1 Tax=Rhodococcus gannanensis TaxID=1960308 RepID=UPI003A972D51